MRHAAPHPLTLGLSQYCPYNGAGILSELGSSKQFINKQCDCNGDFDCLRWGAWTNFVLNWLFRPDSFTAWWVCADNIRHKDPDVFSLIWQNHPPAKDVTRALGALFLRNLIPGPVTSGARVLSPDWKRFSFSSFTIGWVYQNGDDTMQIESNLRQYFLLSWQNLDILLGFSFMALLFT